MNGRQPDDTAAEIVSLGHSDLTVANNVIAGPVRLGGNGNTYIIESQNHGDTLTFNNAAYAIGNDNDNTNARFLTLRARAISWSTAL